MQEVLAVRLLLLNRFAKSRNWNYGLPGRNEVIMDVRDLDPLDGMSSHAP